MKKKFEDAMMIRDGYKTLKQISYEDLCPCQTGQKTKEGEYEMEEGDEEEMD